MSLDFTVRIQSEFSPFFKYATPKNPSHIIASWRDSSKQLRTHLIYKRCVHCNKDRLKNGKPFNQSLDIVSYFCKPCFKKFQTKIIKKYVTIIDPEENKIFNKIWNDYFFGNKYIFHSSQL